MYSENEIQQMKNEAEQLELSAPDLFVYGANDQLTEICNGVGSAALHPAAREVLDLIYRRYETAAAIHDCRYEEAWKEGFTQKQADTEFYENCILIWKNSFGFWRWICPKAINEFFKIRQAYNVLKDWGSSAWNACIAKHDESANQEIRSVLNE